MSLHRALETPHCAGGGAVRRGDLVRDAVAVHDETLGSGNVAGSAREHQLQGNPLRFTLQLHSVHQPESENGNHRDGYMCTTNGTSLLSGFLRCMYDVKDVAIDRIWKTCSPEGGGGRVELEHLVQVGLDEEPVWIPGAHPSDLGTLRDTTLRATEPESGAELPAAAARGDGED